MSQDISFSSVIRSVRWVFSATVFSLFISLPALAQDGGLDEVVITARKQVESAQDVPVAVTVYSATQIDRHDLTSLEKIAASNPQLVVGRGGNGSGAQLTLRGISSQPISIGIEQSIAVIIDGVYYGQGRTVNEGMIDSSRVELLKGPQALFFGKNATAGVIAVTTADPTEEFDMMARVGFEAKGEELFYEGFVSGQIAPNLTARLAVRLSEMFGSHFNNQGFDVTNATFDIATGALNFHEAPVFPKDLPGTSEQFARGTLMFTPSEELTIRLKASFMRRADDANAYNYVPFACASGFTQVNPAVPCRRNFDVYIGSFPADIAGNLNFARGDGDTPFNLYKSFSVTGDVTYELPKLTIVSVFNYQWNRNNWGCSCQNITTPASFISASELSSWKAFSNETRVQSTLDGPFNFMLGVYYQDSKRNFAQDGAFGGLEDSSQPENLRYLADLRVSATDGETTSVFGQVNWQVVEDLEIAGGVRYIHETKDSFHVQTYINAAFQFLFPQDVPFLADQTFNDWTPEATITYHVNEDVTVYGAYRTAYKSGGFSNSALTVVFSLQEDLAFDSETSSGFEAGIKTTLFDNQLRLNATAYSFKYKDLQVDFFNSITFQFITTNAGSAKTKGIEIDFAYAPNTVEGLTLRGSANFNRARYTEYIAPCYGGQSIAEGCTTVFQGGPGQDLSGAPTAVAPKFTASLGGNYDIEVGSGLILGLSMDARYSDKYFGSNFAAPLSLQPSYVNLDASIRLRTENGNWEFAVIGRNLTNHFYFGGTQDLPNTGVGTGTAGGISADQLALASLPRTVRMQLTWRY